MLGGFRDRNRDKDKLKSGDGLRRRNTMRKRLDKDINKQTKEADSKPDYRGAKKTTYGKRYGITRRSR